jgi:hypothetical protein
LPVSHDTGYAVGLTNTVMATTDLTSAVVAASVALADETQ